jgi:hypothetical protein
MCKLGESLVASDGTGAVSGVEDLRVTLFQFGFFGLTMYITHVVINAQ